MVEQALSGVPRALPKALPVIEKHIDVLREAV